MSMTFNHLLLTAVGSYLARLLIPSCEEAIQLVFGTALVLRRCPIMPEIMHGWIPEVFLHQ
jgi:hypothetical protein